MKNVETHVFSQREYFNSNVTKDYKFRREQLKKLRSAIKNYEKRIIEALNFDLNKSEFEAYVTEIGFIYSEIRYSLRKLKKWMKPKKVRSSLLQFPASSKILSEPYGVVLIISPWNYPFLLSISPLIGAIAAGNCSIIKPSELSKYTSNVIEELISSTFDENYIKVIQGDKNINQHLLRQKIDYIFFTGSTNVGKIVMESASKNLIPHTLELGGKSPCFVDETANIDLAAKRIAWGKFVNAGQTCVAPDYILIHKSIKNKFIKSLIKYCDEFYIDISKFPKIISDKHFERLKIILENQDIVYGGKTYSNNIISPTIIDNVNWNNIIMKEEIFGPIIPIIEYDNLYEVINKIKSLDKPLALYIFSNSKANQNIIFNHLSFGGGCINDTLFHLLSHHLPFGGVGPSGIGKYHGKYSFDTFTNYKSILKKANYLDIKLRYPPYKKGIGFIRKIMK